MSESIRAQHAQSRSSLPLVSVMTLIVILLVLAVVPSVAYIRNFYKYRTGPLAQEAMREFRDEEQLARWADANTSRDATIPLSDLDALDFATTSSSVAANIRNDRRRPEYNLRLEDVDTDNAFKAWDHHLVEQIYALMKYPTPVWMPDPYQRGYRFDVLGCYWVVQREFTSAIQARDATRALKALEACNWLANSADYEIGFYITGRGRDIRRNLYELICDSMLADIWSAEQLKELRSKFLTPLDDAARSRSGMLQSYAMAINRTNLFKLDDPRYGFTSEVAFKELEKFDREGFRFMPYDGFTSIEMWRRLAVLGIAAKQFEMDKGTWPDKFEDLMPYDVDPKLWSDQFSGQLSAIQSDKGGGLHIRLVLLNNPYHNNNPLQAVVIDK